ncbi:MAG TPA: alpha/beta hydrolase [Candidatus Eisenbacteria bacterium]|nr:alpha/beta hydrolase [Candidatus Eisenbacteria bacterium]
MIRFFAVVVLSLVFSGIAAAQHPAPTGSHPVATGSTAPAAPTAPTARKGRDVTFRNGDIELRGTVLLPAGSGPFPAVVFLHGSGPQTRNGFERFAQEFASLGIASLRYDKRGTGESKGAWWAASLDDLANDAVAAVNQLKTMKEIDASRIGFWAVSQGGWVAPLAASKAPGTAFLVVVSGGGATPHESEMFAYRQHFKRMGLSPADTTAAVEVLDAYFKYLGTGKDREKVVVRLDTIRNGALAPLAEQLDKILPSEENRSNWSWVATYDPAADIAKLQCPVLLIYGDRDTDQPAETGAARWRAALANGGNDRATIVTFPGADHTLRVRSAAAGGGGAAAGSGATGHEPPTSGGHGGSARSPLAAGYTDLQVGWLWRNVIASGPAVGLD